MSSRLVLRIERDGHLLGSWSLGDAPLQMSMVDLATGQIVARFTASAEALAMVDHAPGQDTRLDELPVRVARAEGDDFTLPLPEPTADGRGLPETEEAPRLPRAGLRNLARMAPEGEDGDGLTGALELVEDGHDELPLDAELDSDSLPGMTGELRTATSSLPVEDQPSVTGRVPRRRASDRALRSAPPLLPRPQPAEVWAQKKGEWRNVGQLIPGQRVSTLGGWVRLAADGRLVVSSGESLAGTATLLDGRMIEIEAGQPFLALPPGSSVMLALGDRGIYVRSEPLVADLAGAQPH